MTDNRDFPWASWCQRRARAVLLWLVPCYALIWWLVPQGLNLFHSSAAIGALVTQAHIAAWFGFPGGSLWQGHGWRLWLGPGAGRQGTVAFGSLAIARWKRRRWQRDVRQQESADVRGAESADAEALARQLSRKN